MITRNSNLDELTELVQYSTNVGVHEYYCIFKTPEDLPLSQSLDLIWNNYQDAILKNNNLKPVYSRFFLSDVENQSAFVIQTKIYKELSKGSIRLIGNEPLDSGMVSIVSYFIDSDEIKQDPHEKIKNSVKLKGKNYCVSYFADLGESGTLCPKTQTEKIFTTLQVYYSEGKISEELLRTWVSVRDIDNNYTQFVKSRKSFFENWGMNKFFPASTGVEGRSAEPSKIVSVDALCISGLQESQIVKMEALNNMPSTLKYGVTFERGLKICFGDRSHYHISGTASIDKKGEVKHIGDIEEQVKCAFNNLKDLLENSKAQIENIAYLIFYIRDAKNIKVVKQIIETLLPHNIPRLYVRSSICRPQWLMEIDGIALGKGDSKYKPFI